MTLKILSLIVDLAREFRKEFSCRPFVVCCETVGTITSMIASVMVSFQLAGMMAVFLLWLVGSVCLSTAGVLRKNLMWTLLSMFYLIMNLVGIALLLI